MTTDKEFFNVKYKEGSLDPKTAQLNYAMRPAAAKVRNLAKAIIAK
jgi:hypothetical protein